jgi:polyisoprenoid-binding protein YceI
MRRLTWLIAVAAAAVLVTAGTFAYIHFVHEDAPARLALDGSAVSGPEATASDAAATSGPTSTVDGTWTVGSGSQAGYRVKENLFGQSTEAVGRTAGVNGSLAVSGRTVTAAQVTVDLTTVASDESRRDGQFKGRIMDVADYPTATFRLIRPIDLGSLPAIGKSVTVPATGELTLRGTTKVVTVNLSVQLDAGTIKVQGDIPITFADWDIPNPSFGPARTEDHGELEFLVLFTR